MKKNGFTLIELLAVIAILGIILTIAVVSVTGILKDSKEDSKDIDDKMIVNATDLYITKNYDNLIKLLEENSGHYTLDIKELVNKGYISVKESIDNLGCVILKKNNNIIEIADVVSLALESDFNFNSGKIKGYTGTNKKILIPSSINGVSVTSIETGAFNNKGLISVVIPNSVTSIGQAAFNNNQLTNVVIGNNVTSIKDYAFYKNQLTSIVIPNSVTSIGQNAFGYNGELKSITIKRSNPYDMTLTAGWHGSCPESNIYYQP